VLVAVALSLAGSGALTLLAGRVYANSVLNVGRRVRFREALRGT